MDTVTHGIAGALLGKAFFSRRNERVAIFAATLGAVFPDSDVVAQISSRDPLAIVKYHRDITHSFVTLPLFAVLLAWLTRAGLALLKKKFPRLREIESPPFWLLTLIYGIGIASHIVLDGMTSFGTRIWSPLSQERAAWDLLFIVDFTFTSIVLVPQIVAWIYSNHEKRLRRTVWMWTLLTLGAFGAWAVARAAGYPFHLWIAGLASCVFAALFLLPTINGWGFRLTRANWCQAGTCLLVAYIFACAVAHHAAMRQVASFATENHIPVIRMGAIPLPPSLLDWGEEIRSIDGVYLARWDLRNAGPPAFRFIPDAPPDAFIARAMELPEVRLYWQFARFPTIHSLVKGDDHEVVFM